MRLKFLALLLVEALMAPWCATAQTVVLPSQTSTDIQRALSLRLSTLNWGARCDGVTQARDKIQLAFTNAATTVPKLANRILAQYGDCAIADDVAMSIVNPLVVDGSGTGATSFKCTFDGTTPILKIDGTREVVLNDLTIDNTACPGRNGIEINNSTKVRINNVTVTGGNFALYIYGNSSDVEVTALKLGGSKKGVVTTNASNLRFKSPVVGPMFGSAAQAFDLDLYTENVTVDNPVIDGAGPSTAIATCTTANPANCTAVGHGLATGNIVSVEGLGAGWVNSNGQYAATVTGPDNFTIPLNSTSLGTFPTGSATVFRIAIHVGVMAWGQNAGGVLSIKTATNANPVVFETIVPHNIPSSSYLVKTQGFTGTWGGATGTFTPTVIDPTHFSIPVDTTAYPAFVITSHNAVFRVMNASVTNANPMVVTRVNHGFLTGQTLVSKEFAGNWEPANGVFRVKVIDADHFSIPIDSTNFGALVANFPGYFFRPLTRNVTVNNAKISNVSNTGFFGSAALDINIEGGTYTNCGDVCVDTEGGAKFRAHGLVLENCGNKCAATFFGQTLATFSEIVANPGNGAGQRHGIYWDDTIRAHDLKTIDCTVITEKNGSVPVGSNVLGTERFTISGNKVTSYGTGTGAISPKRSNRGIIKDNIITAMNDRAINLDGGANTTVSGNRWRLIPGGTDPTAAGTSAAFTNSFLAPGTNGCNAPSTCSGTNVEVVGNTGSGFAYDVRYDYAGAAVTGNVHDNFFEGIMHYRGGAATPIRFSNNRNAAGTFQSPKTLATDGPGIPIIIFGNDGTGNNQSGGTLKMQAGGGIGGGFGGLTTVQGGIPGATNGYGGHVSMGPGSSTGTGVPGNTFLGLTESDVLLGRVGAGFHMTYDPSEMIGTLNASACNSVYVAGDCITFVMQGGRQSSEGKLQRESHGLTYYNNAGGLSNAFWIDWMLLNQNANPKLAGMLIDAGESAASGVISFSADHNLRHTTVGPNTTDVHFQIQSTGLSGVAGGTIPVKVADPGTSYTATGKANSYALTTNWLKEAIATNSWGWIPIYYTSAVVAPGGFSFFNFATQAMELRAIAGGDLPHGSAGYLYSDGVTGVGPQAIALGDLPHATDGFYKVTSGTLGIGAIALGELPHATDGCYTVTSGVLAIGACGVPSLANLPQNGNHGTLLTTGSGSYTINELPPSEIDGATGPGIMMSLASGSSPIFQALDLTAGSSFVFGRLQLTNMNDGTANLFLKANGTGNSPTWSQVDISNTSQVIGNLLVGRLNGGASTGAVFSNAGTVSVIGTATIPIYQNGTITHTSPSCAAGRIAYDASGNFYQCYATNLWAKFAATTLSF